MRQPNFIDFRLIYSSEELSSAGFNHYLLGKGFSKKISSNSISKPKLNCVIAALDTT